MNTGSFDFRFTTPSSAGSVEMLIGNITCFAPFASEASDELTITLTFDTDTIEVALALSTTQLDDLTVLVGQAADYDIRVSLFNKVLTIFVDDTLIYSFVFEEIYRESTSTTVIHFNTSSPVTITDIVGVELSEGREALFADYESTTEAALSSIIQQRPILIIALEKTLLFTYRATRDTIESIFPKEINETEEDNSDLSSDGIVYFSEVLGISSAAVAREFGFITRLYRWPDLTDVGKAVQVTQERALEQTKKVGVVQRFDPRIEPLDVIHVDLILTATQRHIEKNIIAESVSFNLTNGSYDFNFSGREDL